MCIAAIISLVLCHHLVKKQAEPYVYHSLENVPYNKVGLLLGTSKYLKGGDRNPFFTNRIKAAAILYKKGRVSNLIVSGDNSTKAYNEPMTMKRELIKMGVPDSVIYLDYAGFRTFDSVVRCREIFGQTSFTIISQEFHLERAVYIAHNHGIGALGFAASDVGFSFGLKTHLREYFARVLVFIDLALGEEPKFLGEKISIK